MGDRCQKDYQHSVRKQKQAAGTRLSLLLNARRARMTVAAGRLVG
jgi:hypothetical protein